MPKKTQSVGNLIACASYKPTFSGGMASEPIAAFGCVHIGEIVQLPAIRLLTMPNGVQGVEIAGALESESWAPWEVLLKRDRLSVQRSTSWDDYHIQQWSLSGPGNDGDLVLLVDFELVQPGRLTVRNDGGACWETISGDVVILQFVGADIVATAAANDRSRVMQHLASADSVSQFSTRRDDVYRWNGVLGIRMQQCGQGQLIIATGKSLDEAQAKVAGATFDSECLIARTKADWRQYLDNDTPTCPTEDDCAPSIWQEAWYVLRANRMDYATAPLAKPFGSPSKFNYKHQWLWDSGFHAIVWRWSNRPDWAQEEIENLLENPREQGRISHEILYTPWLNWGNDLRGKSNFAPTSQPPVLAMAVEKVYEKTQDRDWLAWAWPRVEAGVRWWSIARDPDGNGLAGWANGWESGLDDSPRWDHIARDGSAYFPTPLEATELNALLVNEWRALSRLAHLLGKSSDADACSHRAEVVKTAMRDNLWDSDAGFFYCRDHNKQSVRIKTIGGLLGLLALDRGDPETAPLLAHLTNPDEFWTPFPAPSVAINEPTFTRGQMWRGPTWVNTNWLLIRAIERLGETQLAQEMSARTLRMLTADGDPRLYEWFDPISGQALGNMDYGWSTLAIDLMMDPVGGR